MRSVRSIYVEALALKAKGLTARQIADWIIKTGHDNGSHEIDERGSVNHDGRPTIELVFPSRVTIYFDGFDWHYLEDSRY